MHGQFPGAIAHSSGVYVTSLSFCSASTGYQLSCQHMAAAGPRCQCLQVTARAHSMLRTPHRLSVWSVIETTATACSTTTARDTCADCSGSSHTMCASWKHTCCSNTSSSYSGSSNLAVCCCAKQHCPLLPDPPFCPVCFAFVLQKPHGP